MKIGILTSGGDCAGLNAVMRGFGKAIANISPGVEIYGIIGGYTGLINREYRQMKLSEFSGILNMGGTILGTSRQPYKELLKFDENNKVAQMKENYRKMDLDVLVTLGGRGTHKTAALLSGEGLNVIGVPKTIDNDIWGTDFTFGFHSAVDVATDCIDRIKTTAASHRRAMIVEIMGNKVGWLTLYAGIGGGADIILIPEIPYSIDAVVKCTGSCMNSKKKGYCVIAVSEGAIAQNEAHLSRKERMQKRAERDELTLSNSIAKAIADKLEVETRVVVPGHIQRGGGPNAYDRVICTQMGAYAAKLALEKRYGVTVAMNSDKMTANSLAEISKKTNFVPPKHELICAARDTGISFGD